MKSSKLTLRWSNEAHERGLERVIESPRGRVLRINKKEIARVDPVRIGWTRTYKGWRWYARCDELGIPLKNDYKVIYDTKEEAEKACSRYVRQCLSKRKPQT